MDTSSDDELELASSCHEAARKAGLIEIALGEGPGQLWSAPALLRQAAGPDGRAEALMALGKRLGLGGERRRV